VVAYLSLWRGKSHQSYLLDWAASFALYVVTLIGFSRLEYHPVFTALLCGLLGLGNVLVLTGVYRFDGVKPFRPWMVPLVLLPGVGYLAPALMGYPAAAQAGATAGFIVEMLVAGVILIGGWSMTSRGGRRIAGFALLGYIPGYILVIVALTTGLPIPDVVALVPMLSDQMLLAILNLGLMAMLGERAQAALRRIALRDSLTGALNRAGLAAHAPTIGGRGIAIIAIDVDHFKAINDQHGHAMGDAVLTALATCAMRHVSGRDLVVRLGGDEFVVVLADATLETALVSAAALRQAFTTMPDLPLWTVSIGVATLWPGERDLAEAMARADRALYDAKASGRNRVAA
jgi:diguanylate cyclase (GGDEF)-like protein